MLVHGTAQAAAGEDVIHGWLLRRARLRRRSRRCEWRPPDSAGARLDMVASIDRVDHVVDRARLAAWQHLPERPRRFERVHERGQLLGLIASTFESRR